MENPTSSEKVQRIASYKVPAGTWALCVLIACAVAAVRFLGDSKLHQIAGFALFALFLVNALNFLIPLLKPDSILGGAKLKTLALAVVALLGLVSIQ